MVVFEKIIDQENPKRPNQENIAKELERKITEIENENNVKLVSACFLGINDVPINDEEDSIFSYAISHNKSQEYMLFFS